MDSYEKLIQNAKTEDVNPINGTKNVKRAINSSRWKLILSTITVILLIVPTCYVVTFAYYAFGTKSTTLMDIASNTLYITEPNATFEEMEFDMEFSLFSMDLSFEQYKQIGGEFYPAKHYDLKFVLNDLVKKEATSKLEKIYPKYPTDTNQWLAYPKQLPDFNSTNEWTVLEGLPDETVVEAYISLDNLYEVEAVENEMKNVVITWAAIYTGMENTKGKVISPIGYPVQPDKTNWSPFLDAASHEETFLNIMKELQPYESIATEVSAHKNLELKERIEYLEKNGFATYGVVVTGPKKEIESLKQLDMVRYLKLGEVKLWNWAR